MRNINWNINVYKYNNNKYNNRRLCLDQRITGRNQSFIGRREKRCLNDLGFPFRMRQKRENERK